MGLGVACGGSDKQLPKAALADGRAVDKHNQDDRSNCDFKGRSDRDVQEVTGPGAVQPNIRRVFSIIGMGEDARRVLLCREVDTNLDGIKDVVRIYNDKGEATQEKADTDLRRPHRYLDHLRPWSDRESRNRHHG